MAKPPMTVEDQAGEIVHSDWQGPCKCGLSVALVFQSAISGRSSSWWRNYFPCPALALKRSPSLPVPPPHLHVCQDTPTTLHLRSHGGAGHWRHADGMVAVEISAATDPTNPSNGHSTFRSWRAHRVKARSADSPR